MQNRSDNVLTLSDVRFGFPKRRDFLGPVSAVVRPGQCWAIVGPNGSGKSTLLRLMAGLLTPDRGTIALDGAALSSLTARARAQRIALVPQHPPADLDLPVESLVLMGRFPHRSLGLFESATDRAVAEHAMEVTQTTRFADRSVRTLSGGELQRVHIAAALTQEPKLLLLDEPTASLDMNHELAIFRILRDRAERDGLAVVVVTHDINLAAHHCTNALLLDDGQVAAIGDPNDVITPQRLAPVFGVSMSSLPVGDSGGRWVVPVDSGKDAT